MLIRTMLGVAAAAMLAACAATTSDAPAASLAPFAGREFDAGDEAAIRAGVHQIVDQMQASGMVTLVVQHGEMVVLDAYGVADLETGAMMESEAIFRIASMTKPITGAALMTLYEEGRWSLDDPITKFIPEFADLKVMTDVGELVAPAHVPTMRELVSHNAGFTYGLFGNSAVDQAYVAADVLDPTTSYQTMIDKLAEIPLRHQPGAAWEYSVSVDIQAAIIERISGQSFDAFLRERLFEPLGMSDTGFAVSGADRDRMATTSMAGPDGMLVPGEGVLAGLQSPDVETLPGLASGGGGLWSTTADYARFCQMILNGGELDGVRILKPGTVALMHANMLPAGVAVTLGAPGTAFGVDFAIAPDSAVSGEPWPAGTFYWSGIFGTFFWIDPTNDLIVIGMIQRVYDPATDPSYNPVGARDMAGRVIYDALNN